MSFTFNAEPIKNKARLDKIVSNCFKENISYLFDKKKGGSPYNNLPKNDSELALKQYCLDNLILLNRKQRTYCLNRLALKVKNAQKIDSEFKGKVFFKPKGKKKYSLLDEANKCELKSFKVLIEVRAYNEADMREIVAQANDSEIEWWCCNE
jgi:hypothetical protein